LKIKLLKYILLSVFSIIFQTSSFSQGIKIHAIGSEWKFQNHVSLEFQFGSCDSLKLGKKIFRDIKRKISDPLKPTVEYHFSTGYLSGNTWYFDRDSAWLKDNGLLQMVMSNTDEEFPCSDTLKIQLIKLTDIKVDISSSKYYFTELFKEVKVTLASGESDMVKADFEGNSNILQGIKMESNTYIIKGQGDFGKANYRLPELKYTKNIWLKFIDKSTGYVLQSVKLPNTFYIRDCKISANGQNKKIASHGKWGSMKLLSNALDTLYFNEFKSLNGGNGQDGFLGNDAKDFKIKVERVNKKDSVAKITVFAADSTYIYLIDLFGGGNFTLEANGESGGWGGNAGLFGTVFYKIEDSVRIWKRGKEGLPGNGNNGGNGGNVTIEIDRIYEPIIDRIKIENKGGKMGFGGVKNYPTNYNYPYFTGEGALLLKTWEKIFGYSDFSATIKNHLVNMKYYEGNPNLGKSGKPGIDGKTRIIYLN
jgi:hypothetical protein